MGRKAREGLYVFLRYFRRNVGFTVITVGMFPGFRTLEFPVLVTVSFSCPRCHKHLIFSAAQYEESVCDGKC